MAEKLGTISLKTVCKWLKRIRFTRKKKVWLHRARWRKAQFLSGNNREKNAGNILYIDESAIDDNEEYPYALNKKGSRVYALKQGFKRKRLSIISALNQNVLKAPFVFEGKCNRENFEAYLANILLPELKTGQTIIRDNTRLCWVFSATISKLPQKL